MATIEEKRHTLAHLLAAAVLERYPHAKATIGPAVDNGFYYDFDFAGGAKPGDGDLAALESSMRDILASWDTMTGTEVSEKDALDRFKDNPYKTELIKEISAKAEPITLYTAAGFTDLCRGGHSEYPAKDIPADSFILERIAGAYWRGDEKNPQLTRIYGLAFDTKGALDAYQTQQEEAKKRDHRKLGKELDLFAFSDLVGSGLPLFTPKGTTIRRELEQFVWSLMEPYGYERVTIPHMAKSELYKRSGHYQKFADDIFFISSKKTDDEFIMKPMNCPHHTQIYASRPRSYRDLPLRFSEVTTVYRDENTGQLAGLTRVRSITQDDAHVFCTEAQVAKEVEAIYDIITKFYGVFGMPLSIRLSVNDPAKPENYLGSPEVWERSVGTLKKCLESFGRDFVLGVGEAAFYGPKIDFIATDAIGREWQLATIQLDFNLPERFALEYTAEDGSRTRPVMIHRAISGSLERFMGVIIEHYAGAFPAWLAPVQVRVLPVSEKHAAYAEELKAKLRAGGVRAEVDAADESLGKKIRNGKGEKIPYLLVVGDKEVTDKTVTAESRDNGKLEPLSIEDFTTHIQKEIRERA